MQFHIVIFWRNRYRVEESAQFGTILRPHESKGESQGSKLFVLYFAIKNKKYTEKRLSEYLYYSSRYFRRWKLRHLDHGGIFHCILNMSHNLLKKYKEKSLKESTREKRGARQRRKVTSETKLPSKWKMFLQVTNNKEELFYLLTQKV